MWSFQKMLSKMLICLFQLSGELVIIIAAVNVHLWFRFTACCSTLKYPYEIQHVRHSEPTQCAIA
jgi:hypothetical protein